MFRKAKAAMENEIRNNQSGYTYENQTGVSLATAEKAINVAARKLAQEYVRDQTKANENQKLLEDQVYLVYKFLRTPEEVILQGMQQMDQT
jgi:hypothetical protein